MPLFGPNVEKLKERGEVRKLVWLLGHKDPAVADRAESALISLKDHQNWGMAGYAFGIALADDAGGRRATVVLSALGDELVVSFLGGIGRDQASQVIGALSDERAVAVLVGTLTRDGSIWAEREWAANELRRRKDPEAIGPLAKAALEGKDLTKHMHALSVLGKLGDEWAVDQLIAMLEDPEAGFDPGHDRATEFLTSLVGTREEFAGVSPTKSVEQTRTFAVHFLGGHKLGNTWVPGIGGPRVVEALGRVLKNAEANREPPGLCQAIVDALRECGDPQAVEALSAATATAPASVMRCCICGTDLRTSPAMVDHVTGAVFCKQHASLQSTLLTASDFSECNQCGFKYSTSHSELGRDPQSTCPSCGSTLGDSVLS